MPSNKPHPPLPDLMDFSVRVEGLQFKSPTELVILSMAYLDKALELALITKLENLDGGVRYALFDGNNAPLRNLAGKMDLARALGLVGPAAHKDMALLRSIRNKFAHRFDDPTWADPEIGDLVQRLILDNQSLIEDLPSAEFQDIKVEQRIPLANGATIDTSIHDVITDKVGAIGFFCRSDPAEEVSDPRQRRYLRSYWAVQFQVMAAAVTEWEKRTL